MVLYIPDVQGYLRKHKEKTIKSRLHVPKCVLLFGTIFLLTTAGCLPPSLIRAVESPLVECRTVASYVKWGSQVAEAGEDMITLERVWSRTRHVVKGEIVTFKSRERRGIRPGIWEDKWVPVDTLEILRMDMVAFLGALAYTGIEGSVVHLNYREAGETEYFQPRSMDMRYDLEESRDIRFRSLSIRVMEATSTHIQFAVTEDRALPWLPNPARLSHACDGTLINYSRQ